MDIVPRVWYNGILRAKWEQYPYTIENHSTTTTYVILINFYYQVPLGVLPKNENKIEDMVCIMDHLHQYVPTLTKQRRVQVSPASEEEEIHEHKFHKVLLGGDQLTVARARGCQLGRGNSDSAIGKLKGLIPVAEDWHTGVVLLTVIYIINNQWY